MTETRYLPETEIPGKRLGRHVNHDDRSRAYVVVGREAWSLASVQHPREIPIFDQGALGSCTGNAAVGALGTGGLYDGIGGHAPFGEEMAVSVYSAATVIDGSPGTYKPDDTGSDGLSVAKVLKTRGYISGYRHAFSLNAALTALQDDAVITGINWYEGFDSPDSSGLVTISGSVRGGHEVVVDGIDVVKKIVWATNSWGPDWGLAGRFCFSWNDWGRLLSEQGDVTVLVPKTAPIPTPTPTPTPTPPEPEHDLFQILEQFVAKLQEWLKTWKRG